MSRPQVEEVAEDWAARAHDRGGPDWLSDFIASIGGEIRPSPEPSPLLLVAERIDCFVATGADQWSMAEALGHLVLHIGHVEAPEGHPANRPVVLAVPTVLGPSGPLARARLEAVWFASAFLMPSARFQEIWQRTGGNLRQASAELGMPRAMVAARAVRLGLA